MLLPAGRPHDAVRILEVLPNVYVKRFSNPGFNVIASHFVKALMAALKVLADALMQTGATDHSNSSTFLYAMQRREVKVMIFMQDGFGRTWKRQTP